MSLVMYRRMFPSMTPCCTDNSINLWGWRNQNHTISRWLLSSTWISGSCCHFPIIGPDFTKFGWHVRRRYQTHFRNRKSYSGKIQDGGARHLEFLKTVWRTIEIGIAGYRHACMRYWCTGLGYSMVIINTLIGIYYNVIIAWTIHYFFSSMTSQLPWENCDNWWNSENCVTPAIAKNMSGGEWIYIIQLFYSWDDIYIYIYIYIYS